MTEDFAEPTTEKREFESNKKPVFMRMKDGGTYDVRILEPRSKKFYTHFLGGKYSIKCLGTECPICARNSEIYAEDPENYYKNPEYRNKQKRWYVNVLDKTMVKKCSNCGYEFTNMNVGICSNCSTALDDPSPSNTVKILSKGPSLFEDQLNVHHKEILDDDGEQIGINNFDIKLVVRGKGKDTVTTAIPEPHKNDPVQDGLDLFDLENIVIELEPDEMLDVQRGVSLKDIFAARRAEDETEFPPESSVSEKDLEDVNAKVAELFSD